MSEMMPTMCDGISFWNGKKNPVTLVNTVVTTLLAIDDDEFHYRNVVRRRQLRRSGAVRSDVPGVLYANVRDITGPAGRTINSAPAVIRSNEWQHVALTYDSVSGDTRLYVNGNVVANVNLGGAIPQTSYPVYIGHRPAGSFDSPSPGGRTFQGGIDEIAL